MMKLIVVDERQEALLRQAISDYEDAGHSYESAKDSLIVEALLTDICEQMDYNKVTAEDCEKLLDSHLDLRF